MPDSQHNIAEGNCKCFISLHVHVMTERHSSDTENYRSMSHMKQSNYRIIGINAHNNS